MKRVKAFFLGVGKSLGWERNSVAPAVSHQAGERGIPRTKSTKRQYYFCNNNNTNNNTSSIE